MLTMSTNLSPIYPAMSNPYLGMWSELAGVYRGAMKANAEQLVLSSAKIIQEHMLRALITTSQSCADALTKNAMSIQQQSMERFSEANGKAVAIMGRAYTQAWTASLPPAK